MFRLSSLFIVMIGLLVSTSALAQQRFGELYCNKAGYSCLTTTHKDQTWESLWPNPRERTIVQQINRMNIKLEPGIRIAVPDNLSKVTLLQLAPFSRAIKPKPNRNVMLINLKKQAWVTYSKHGQLIRWGALSAGGQTCSGDKTGTCGTGTGAFVFGADKLFSGVTCQGPDKEGCGRSGQSKCLDFARNPREPPYAMYASDKLPGYPSTQGCIWVLPSDASWLEDRFLRFQRQGKRGTRLRIMQ